MSDNNAKSQRENRDLFTSKAGFILACIGSAVGMGNIWMFPYRIGQFGGAAFLIPYILFIVLLGCTGLMGEFAFGRMTQSGPIGSFKNALETKDKKGGGLFGIIPVLGAFGIAVGYAVVVGWFIKFLVGSISGEALKAIDSGAYFGAIAGPFGSVMWHFLALLITALILLLGVSNGIEKVNKIMMPTFYILFLLLLVRVLMLDGAKDGINYLFVPKWEYLSQPKTWIYALGQAFFSLSIAGSGMIVYGSYLKRDIDIPNAAKNTVVFDTLAALTAGLVIIPAVFAFNLDPTAGPPLLFITLPSVFKLMPFGRIFAIIFFISVLFASITSLMNLLEVPIEAIQSNLKLSRKLSVILVCFLAFIFGLFVESGDVLGKWMDFVSIYIIPLGAFIAAIMFFWVIGIDKAKSEIETGSKKLLGSWFNPMAKYIYVFLTLIVLIAGILLGGIG
ncbi:MAG: sodium-dependent transporter [Terrisporobacter othiniensis]|uniref:sodium-dependent transporter n=1 Tax=Terrisporobacter petrolearius TaxID=1460447 RepID=UPI0022E03333|nr:sodium-dependent transporter [Terrisporobacter petrolearius]MDU4860982.1 sodium-dependent transporter [Terrisporobacter othiniensis]MDU6993560.1 sodium-dependent transporter [Terrisporobacter othiniensis]